MISNLELFRCIATYVFSTVATRNTWVSDQHCGCWSSGYEASTAAVLITHPCISSSVWIKMILAIGNHKNTENKRSSIWQLCCHWWHHRLSLWQLTVPPVTTTLSNWSFVFSEYSNKGVLPSTVFWLAHCINITLFGCCRLTMNAIIARNRRIQESTIHIPHQL